jgi:hypothetical protein
VRLKYYIPLRNRGVEIENLENRRETATLIQISKNLLPNKTPPVLHWKRMVPSMTLTSSRRVSRPFHDDWFPELRRDYFHTEGAFNKKIKLNAIYKRRKTGWLFTIKFFLNKRDHSLFKLNTFLHLLVFEISTFHTTDSQWYFKNINTKGIRLKQCTPTSKSIWASQPINTRNNCQRVSKAPLEWANSVELQYLWLKRKLQKTQGHAFLKAQPYSPTTKHRRKN